MLLDHNTERVIKLLDTFDYLKITERLRLVIYLLENPQINIEYDTSDFIKLLKEVLGILDPSYKKIIEYFGRRKTLLLMSASYLEFSKQEKKQFSVEMLFNIYNFDFEDKSINEMINKNLNVYDYAYSVLE